MGRSGRHHLRIEPLASRPVTKPAQVYICLWSHAGGEPGHIHFVVQPVTKEQRQRHGGGVRIQVALFDAKVLPPADEVEAFATKARATFC